ncbi:MAG TPA: O-antigen ligase [Candidatus Acidoferrum sp.]|jgi:O-antigen ligase
MKSISERLGVLFLLLLSTGAAATLFVGQASTTMNNSGDSPVLQILFALLYLLVLYWLIPLYKDTLFLLSQERWMALLILFALASTIWSVDGGETLRRSIGLTGTTLAGLYIALRYQPKEQIRILAVCIAVGAIGSLVVGLAFPGMGVMAGGAWNGVFFIKNTLGRMMSLGVLTFTFLALGQRRYRIISIVMICLCTLLLLLAQSATGLVVCVLMLAAIPFRHLVIRPNRSLTSAILVVAMITIPVGFLIWSNQDSMLNALGRESSLTGRLPLWHAVRSEIDQRPWLGSGYTAFWSTGDAERYRQTLGWDAPNAHNGFLDMALGLGVVGLAIFSIGMLRNFARGIVVAGQSDELEAAWPLFFLIFCFLYNLTESTLFSGNSVFWMLYTANAFWLVRAMSWESALEPVEDEPPSAIGGLIES